MLRTYWLTAIRYLKKHKMYTVINIGGLSIGLAACLLIFMYIQHELKYDTFHDQADRIVRATMEYSISGTVNQVATTGTKLGPQSQRSFPMVEKYVRTFLASRVLEVKGQPFEENDLLYADKDFFNVFSFKLVEGKASHVFNEPNTLVLTESRALKYFGTTRVIGETLKMGGANYMITGVCADAPSYSQIKFGMVTDFMNLGKETTAEQWWTANWVTYLLLAPGTSVPVFQNQLNAYMQSEPVKTEARIDGDGYLKYILEPLKSVHLYSALPGLEPNGNIKNIYMFGLVAILILLIAGANYTNLATAQSAGRASEMGMRKAIGASRRDLFLQFIGESTVITLFSGLLAIILAWLTLPAFNIISLNQFTALELLSPVPLISLLILLLILAFFAGAYPALVISGMRALQVMKSSFKLSASTLLVRRTLIIAQFSISVFLIIYTLVMLQQMRFMQNKKLGYQKEQMIILPVDGRMREQYDILKESIASVPGVLSVSGANETPELVLWGDGVTAVDESGTHSVTVNAMPVDIGFLNTLNMELLAGRDFGKQDLLAGEKREAANASSEAFIINESLANKIGWEPGEAIGRQLSRNVDGHVVGVVKDFHFQSLHQPVTPMLMFLEPGFVRHMIIRLEGRNITDNIKDLEDWWKQRVPHRPFSYRFLDESYAKLYESEKRVSMLFISVSVIAIILACLGLFGLASFTVVQRTREIGIRKVLGANTSGIVWLIAKQFLALVGIGIIIALPAGWVLGQQWLNDFAYRSNLSVLVFLMAAFGAVLLAFATISVQAVKAAHNNPINSLRTE
jgi:putative ABC transport system permease protein